MRRQKDVPQSMHDVVNIQMLASLFFVVAAIVLYASEKLSLEVTSLSLAGGLVLFYHFFPVLDDSGENLLGVNQLLSGFADPALISVICLLVIGQAIVHTGALESMVRWLNDQLAGSSRSPLLVMLMIVLFGSAVLNNTPIVIIFIPLFRALAESRFESTSRYMMPLGFAAVLGGMTTLVGSSTNLLAAGAAEKMGLPRIGFFDFTIIGTALALCGLTYVVFVAPHILGRFLDRASKSADKQQSGKHFIAELPVNYGSKLVGEACVAGQFPSLKDITVRVIIRDDEQIFPPYDDEVLQPKDVLVLAGTRQALTKIFRLMPELWDTRTDTDEDREGREMIMAEVVMAPSSFLVGRMVGDGSFKRYTNLTPVGIERRSRIMRTGMQNIELHGGDVLLVIGRRKDVRNLRKDRGVMPLEWSTAELPQLTHAKRTSLFFWGMILLAAFGVMPISVGALVCVTLMLLTGCIPVFMAVRAVDHRLFLLVGAALALGTALETSGAAGYIAQLMVHYMNGLPPSAIMSGLFLVVMIMTNILSNQATAVLFTPIGISIAQAINVDPIIFVYTVILAANCSFATPISHPTNLLVMGPGHYKFSDFMLIGLPLTLLMWLVFSLFAPWYYGLA